MRLCRFDDDRLGVVQGDRVRDVSAALDAVPARRWPLPPGDPLIANYDLLRPRIEALLGRAPSRNLSDVELKSPVANPNKLIGAPINYNDHIEESKKDQGIAHGREIKTIGDWGLFLKANSALVGPSEGVALRFTDRRNDHEAELAVIIGSGGSNIPKAKAFDHIFGYAIGLDMTVRGTELPSFRKSIDSYAVLGPWLVTKDEIADPDALDFSLTVNGEVRQKSNTRHLVYGVARLIEYASSFYTLHPGDVIYTGTPSGVAPVKAGDVMRIEMQGIGSMTVAVRN
ncbi:MAG: fumarylacetoacetate hydrolase family protein, partial [Alphaproteobacteria bacterium]|nr:fumarylacetoacetate hydrolase family protein [Alphaproteobacteria bacterium]